MSTNKRILMHIVFLSSLLRGADAPQDGSSSLIEYSCPVEKHAVRQGKIKDMYAWIMVHNASDFTDEQVNCLAKNLFNEVPYIASSKKIVDCLPFLLQHRQFACEKIVSKQLGFGAIILQKKKMLVIASSMQAEFGRQPLPPQIRQQEDYPQEFDIADTFFVALHLNRRTPEVVGIVKTSQVAAGSESTEKCLLPTPESYHLQRGATVTVQAHEWVKEQDSSACSLQ